MAHVSRSEKLGKKKVTVEKDGKLNLGELPQAYTAPGGGFDDFSYLVHGPKKIGKTKLSLQGGKVFVLQHDPPQRAYKRIERVCRDWETFVYWLKKLKSAAKAGKYPYDRIVIDRCDVWFKNCQKYVCKKLAIEHPSEEGWGKGWDLLRDTFNTAVDDVLSLPGGKWFLCHSSWDENEDRDGDVFKRLEPDLTKTADSVLNGKVDLWASYQYAGKRRVLIIRGEERVGAGGRIDGHFMTPSGEPVRCINMGKSAEEGFENFKSSFNNKLEDYVPVKKSESKKKKSFLGK